jgi:hypothetical protein
MNMRVRAERYGSYIGEAGTRARKSGLAASGPRTSCSDAYDMPIRMPVAKTSRPPTTTWKAAEMSGVSM